MKYYTHLTYEERVRIGVMKQNGFDIRLMARELNCSASTLSRELWRNKSPPGAYWPDTVTYICQCAKQQQVILILKRQLNTAMN